VYAASRRQVRKIAHDAVHRTIRWAAGRLGYEVLWPSYYNGLPRFGELPLGHWERRSRMAGVVFDAAPALAYLRDELSDHLAEFAPGTEPAGPCRYYEPNGGFDGVDSALAWAMIRRHRPRRVLELGSGFSTLLIRDALAVNGDGASHVVIDPFPRDDLFDFTHFDLRRVSAGALPLDEFERLSAHDVLFVDTTHTVKLGSEVNHVVLDGLPQLAGGVLVHFHDIFLPYEYPRELVEGLDYHWAEQYLLQAFLAFNEHFDVLVPAHLLAREHDAEMAQMVTPRGSSASSVWLQRGSREQGALDRGDPGGRLRSA
jgi:hypothetical protein